MEAFIFSISDTNSQWTAPFDEEIASLCRWVSRFSDKKRETAETIIIQFQFDLRRRSMDRPGALATDTVVAVAGLIIELLTLKWRRRREEA